jgi:hypothetical protein
VAKAAGRFRPAIDIAFDATAAALNLRDAGIAGVRLRLTLEKRTPSQSCT